MRTPQEVAQIEARLLDALRQAGLRLTVQRRAICRYLAETDEHPTAQDIFRALKPQYPSLSLATVYNTVDLLVRLGAIHALGTAGDEAVHYDADVSPHVNLACIRCHRVVDLPSTQVQFLEEEVRRRSGYRVLGARVLYYGLCPQCQAQASASSTSPTFTLSQGG